MILRSCHVLHLHGNEVLSSVGGPALTSFVTDGTQEPTFALSNIRFVCEALALGSGVYDQLGETFKTQKSLIEKVKSIFNVLSIQKNQDFIKAFVLTYGKVLEQNKAIKKVYYGPNDCTSMPSYFTNSKCLHVGFEDDKEVTVAYIKTLWLLASILKKLRFKKCKSDRLQEYRLSIYPDVVNFRSAAWQYGCVKCKVSFDDVDSPVPHVDHCGDKEFRHIVKDFENQSEETINFVKFHRALAKYQLLCEDCHTIAAHERSLVILLLGWHPNVSTP